METNIDTPSHSWEGYREEIRRLYIEEGKTLEYVMKYMEHVHSFTATKSQYEAYLKKWNFRKNSKQEDWKIISYKLEKRKRDGKDIEVYMGDDEIAPKKLKKETLRNAPSFLERLHFQKQEPPTPPGFSFSRPVSAAQSSIGRHVFPEDRSGHRTSTHQLPSAKKLPAETCSRSPSPDLETLQWAMRDLGRIPWVVFGSMLESKVSGMLHPDSVSGLATVLQDFFMTSFQLRTEQSSATGSSELAFPEVLPHIVAVIPPHAEHIFRLLRGRQPLGPQTTFTTVLKMFKYVSYLISNQLCTETNIQRLATWFRSTRNIQVFHGLFSIGGPTIEAIAEQLLKYFVEDDNAPAVHMLLHHGIEPTCAALHHAISKRNVGMVKLVCKSISGLNLAGIEHQIVRAVLSGNVQIAEALFTLAASVDLRLPEINRLLEASTLCKESGEMTKMVLAAGGEYRWGIEKIQNALIQAAQFGNVYAAEALLEAGADINFASKPKGTAVDYAANEGHFHMVRFLLGHGALIGTRQRITPDLPLTTIQWAVLGDRSILPLVSDQSEILPNRLSQQSPQEVLANRLKIARLLLRKGAEANDPPPIGVYDILNKIPQRTLLQFSVEKKLDELVLLLLEYGADIDAAPAPNGGVSAMQAAVRSGNAEILNLLISRGGNVIDTSTPETSSNTLVEAAKSGLHSVVHSLLENGADVNTILPLEDHIRYMRRCDGACGTTALYHAFARGDLGMIDLLTARGADINACIGNTVLQAAVISNDLEVILACIDLGVDLYDEFAILMAFKKGSPGVLNTLVRAVIEKMRLDHNRGQNAHLIHNVCKLALRAAIEQGETTIVKDLVNAGTGLDPPTTIRTVKSQEILPCFSLKLAYGRSHRAAVVDSFGFTPLLVAIVHRKLTIVQFLLQEGADIDARGEVGLPYTTGRCTPLQAAIYYGVNDIVEALLAKGAKVDSPARGKNGRTALQAATESGNIALVQRLLDRGANPNELPARSGGATALQIAAICGYIKLAMLLLEHGAEIDAPRAVIYGRTAIEGASESGRIDMVHFLLNSGAKLVTSDPQHCRRVFRRAYQAGHHALIRILKSHLRQEGQFQALSEDFKPLTTDELKYDSDFNKDSDYSSTEDEDED